MRLRPSAYVKPDVKRNENDAADAEAICEALARPSMRYVTIKSAGVFAKPQPWLRRRYVEEADSGGELRFVSPGLQYVTKRWVAAGRRTSTACGSSRSTSSST